MNASRITGFIGIALGIGLMNSLGFSGILFGGLFGALGGAVGGVVGYVIEHRGKSDNFVSLVDNILWAILFFIPGVFIGFIITSNLNNYLSNTLQTLINVVIGVAFSFYFTRRKIKKKHTIKNLFDDNSV